MKLSPIIENQLKDLDILIVDDKPENIKLLHHTLKKAGYKNIHSITDSRLFWEELNNRNAKLVLLDIRMPHKSGIDILNEMAKNDTFDYIPVIVLTAQADTETRLQSLKLGANDFLTKPFNTTEVLHRIRNILAIKLLHDNEKKQKQDLEIEVQIRTKELQESRLDFIMRLGRAAEYKDNETGLHIIRMSKYSQILALEVGLGEDLSQMILHAAPMHDIGKIGIADNILQKPGKLDVDEFEIMKTHSQIGANILSDHPSQIVKMAQGIALTHHEKWDGTGYPNGIEKENIPIEGRIAAICDVFDALTSRRPYKEPWTVEKSVDLIREQSGKHFDPELVDAFIKVLPKILIVKEQNIEK